MNYSLNEKIPKVHASTYIAPGAHIIGDVELQEDSSVWFNAVVRADNAKVTIGIGSNVQDGAVIHVDEGFPAAIGDHVVVGHNATLHGCTVRDGALIGMGATVLNAAVIEEGALVAAGALVREGMNVPAGMLAAGVPAKIVRELLPLEQERIVQSARGYIEKAQLYKSKGMFQDPHR
ncbi:MAG TPA: gamma carbonic anhydrase family protein [Bacillales bacterium]|nr:gamma carbonic anhydrase family protein [Bacillales bacterium]